jgi:hypothetical protein
MNTTRRSLSLLAGIALTVAGSFTVSAVVHPPDVNPASFTPGQVISNQYFPLPVGRLFIYEGTKEGVHTHDEMCVTVQTRLIQGVQATEVRHRAFMGSPLVLVEDTKDWFAQDIFRKVWYLGEDTIEFPSGRSAINTFKNLPLRSPRTWRKWSAGVSR